MNGFEKPIILISRCIGFEACRYNGGIVKDSFIENMSKYVNFISVCPEIEIGMSTPRDPIRLVKKENQIRLVQPKTGKDYTKSMEKFSKEFLDNVGEIDGCILKSRSPSCGIKDVKIYNSIDKGSSSSKGKGIFGAILIDKIMGIAIEDDGRLKDFDIREHFLTKVFIMHEFRKVKQKRKINELMEFHKKNNLLFLMYNKSRLNILNNIISKGKVECIDEILNDYENTLKLIFIRNARNTSRNNLLLSVFKRFSYKVSEEERRFVLKTIEKYKEGHIPYSVPLYLIKSYAFRFNDIEIIDQSLFNPYPEELVEMRDSGKALT
ncbi:2-thiouracil desulfurase family protein [Clostridium brassicae]|uniref:DUF523 and DUF1722 domain-containing protein n=1 Tax=Clostridium brassicae TaxID=2999072 RepID=A0ABT4DAS4_9CLOT|nr:DUF523 and DUF1722 domain-containing protein [Clostridium brassicae]MCY6959411.1 DUF523 and DUF1722 domain-containing protein [Clostridium brassicae]